MAVIKFGAIVTDARGKLGGHVFGKNQHGNSLGTKAVKAVNLTQWQARRGNNMNIIIKAWNNLSEANKNQWRATALEFPYTNKFGDKKTMNGYNFFVKTQQNRLNASYPLLTSQPKHVQQILKFPTGGIASVSLGFVSVNGPAYQIGYSRQYWATDQMTPGRVPRESDYHLIKATYTNLNTNYRISPQWQQRYGPLKAGQKIHIKTRFVSVYGTVSPFFYITINVVG